MKRVRALNDEKMVYLGTGWRTLTEEKDGVFAICHTAGVIASTTANQSITYTVIRGATDLLETFTYAQYEDAIQTGTLLPSMSNDGSIGFNSGVNTLVHLPSTRDGDWKKSTVPKPALNYLTVLTGLYSPKHKLSPGASFQVERYNNILDTREVMSFFVISDKRSGFTTRSSQQKKRFLNVFYNVRITARIGERESERSTFIEGSTRIPAKN